MTHREDQSRYRSILTKMVRLYKEGRGRLRVQKVQEKLYSKTLEERRERREHKLEDDKLREEKS